VITDFVPQLGSHRIRLKNNETATMDLKWKRFLFRGVLFNKAIHNIEVLEALEDFSVQDDDLYIVTYPKSGEESIFIPVALLHHC